LFLKIQLSQALPTLSPSESAWDAFAMDGQLSASFSAPSPSRSVDVAVAVTVIVGVKVALDTAVALCCAGVAVTIFSGTSGAFVFLQPKKAASAANKSTTAIKY
jgi:hypothetical protein